MAKTENNMSQLFNGEAVDQLAVTGIISDYGEIIFSSLFQFRSFLIFRALEATANHETSKNQAGNEFHGLNVRQGFCALTAFSLIKLYCMKTLLTVMVLVISVGLNAQLKTSTVCPQVYIDILGGKVNGVEPDFTQGQVKSTLRCFTSLEEENTSSICGGLIAYKDKDIYFYTGRDYVEIREKFKGKLS